MSIFKVATIKCSCSALLHNVSNFQTHDGGLEGLKTVFKGLQNSSVAQYCSIIYLLTKNLLNSLCIFLLRFVMRTLVSLPGLADLLFAASKVFDPPLNLCFLSTSFCA